VAHTFVCFDLTKLVERVVYGENQVKVIIYGILGVLVQPRDADKGLDAFHYREDVKSTIRM